MDASYGGGRYHILEKIGEGGMGTVFKAEDASLKRTVAIKVMKGADEQTASRYAREIQTTARLSHPNIVRVLDSGAEKETPYLVLEYLEGQSLRVFLKEQSEGRCALSTALQITTEVCQALEHAHQQGVLHRDIKPENIMLSGEGQAKLMDFGLAKAMGMSTLTQSGAMLGTPAYLPPEQPLGKGSDERSDLYSLGCVLYEMVTGKHPFPADNPVQVIFSHINDVARLPRQIAREIPSALEQLVLKLMAKNPDDRYQSATELLADLQAMPTSRSSTSDIGVVPEQRWAQTVVGRDEELASLQRRLDEALAGQSRLVFVSGEAGIGKTRLSHELGTYAVLRGARFIVGRAQQGEGRSPYRPWIEVLRQLVRETPADQLGEWCGEYTPDLSRFVPEVAKKLDISTEAPGGDPAQLRDRLFDGVTHFVINASEYQPLVLLFDDLQWSDADTFHLLGHGARYIQREGRGQLLGLAAFRELDLESNNALSQVVSDLNRDRLYQPLALKRLDAPQVEEMIRQRFGKEAPSELVELVYEKTEGNPFYVEELLRVLLEEGVIVLGEEGWQTRDTSQVHVPDTVQAMVKDQLARFPEEGRKTLTAAAIIGREFEFPVLQAVAENDEETLIDWLDAALQARLIEDKSEPGNEKYAFSDSLIRDVLYEEVSAVRRRRHHLKVADAIENIHAANLDVYVEALAHHFLEGNQVDKAIQYAIKSAKKASAIFAWHDAWKHYQVALELVGDGVSEQRADILHELASVAWLVTANADDMERYAVAALEIYGALDIKQKLVRSHMFLNTAYLGGTWDGAREWQAMRHIDEILALTEDQPDTVERAMAYQRKAHLHLHLGEPGAALTWTRKAVDILEALSIPMGTGMGTALTYTGQIDDGIRYSEGNWEGVKNSRHPVITSAYGHELALTLALARNVSEAHKWAGQVLEWVNEFGINWADGMLLRPLILIQILAGKSALAEENVQAELEVEKVTFLGCYFEDAVAVALFHMRRGQLDAARDYLEKAFEEHQRRNTISAIGACSYGLGYLEFLEGNLTLAEEHLLRSLEICRNGDNVLFELWVLPLLVEVALKRNQLEQAKTYIERGFELLHPDQNWYGLPALMDRAKGMLAAALEKWDDAQTAFEKAVALNREFGMPWDEASALYEWGKSLEDQGDTPAARAKFELALALFEQVEAVPNVEQTQAALKRL